MSKYIKAKVQFELFEDTDQLFIRQYADREDAQKAMKRLGFDCYKVVAEFSDYIEVIFAKKIEEV